MEERTTHVIVSDGQHAILGSERRSGNCEIGRGRDGGSGEWQQIVEPVSNASFNEHNVQ